MGMDNEDYKVASKGKLKSYEVEYESLSQTAVERLMQRDVDHICGILGVDVRVFLCIPCLFCLTNQWLFLPCGVQMSTASLLLRHSKWNKERLIEKYMDNPTTVLVAAGVTVAEVVSPSLPARTLSNHASNSSSRKPSRGSRLLGLASGSKSSNSIKSSPTLNYAVPKAVQKTSSKKLDEPFVCIICCNDAPGLQTLSLDCEHAFCSICWLEYVSSKIKDESEHTIRCMAEGCALVVPDNVIQSILVPDPSAPVGDSQVEEQNLKTWTRFLELLVRHFVACNAGLKFCPYPSCTNTVSCPSASSKSSLTSVVPTVSCGARGIGGDSANSPVLSQSQQFGLGLQGKEHKFCFGCPIERDHRPVVCGVAKMWLKKCRDDSETANWIKSNTKECSNCQSTIEKNGGCKYVYATLLFYIPGTYRW
jgi:ariadne-1